MQEPLPGKPFEVLPTDLAGLSLLDYFAAKAAPALVALLGADLPNEPDVSRHDDIDEMLVEVAFYSYRLARYMAAEREQ